MYLIFMSFCLVSEILVFFLIPETRNRPVEEMGVLFGETEEVVLHITDDGKGIKEMGTISVQKLEVAETV